MSHGIDLQGGFKTRPYTRKSKGLTENRKPKTENRILI